MKIKLLFILLLSSLMLLTAAIPVMGADSPAQTVWKMLVPQSTSSLPLMLMAQDDPLPGIDLQIEVFINHPTALAALLKGDAQLLYTGTSQGWSNYLDGSPIMIVNTGVWGVSYLMGKDASLKSFADLKGKRLALPFPGAPLDFQTRYILKQKGLDPDKDVQLSYSPFPQTVPKLLAGELDVAPLPEPLASTVEKKGILRLIDYKVAWADVTGGNQFSPQVSLFAAQNFCQSNAALLREFMTQWQHANERVQAQAGDIAKQFAEALGSPAAIVEPSIKNTLFQVPAFAEHQKHVLDYYNLVKTVFPEDRPLKDDFFFKP